MIYKKDPNKNEFYSKRSQRFHPERSALLLRERSVQRWSSGRRSKRISTDAVWIAHSLYLTWILCVAYYCIGPSVRRLVRARVAVTHSPCEISSTLWGSSIDVIENCLLFAAAAAATEKTPFRRSKSSTFEWRFRNLPESCRSNSVASAEGASVVPPQRSTSVSQGSRNTSWVHRFISTSIRPSVSSAIIRPNGCANCLGNCRRQTVSGKEELQRVTNQSLRPEEIVVHLLNNIQHLTQRETERDSLNASLAKMHQIHFFNWKKKYITIKLFF